MRKIFLFAICGFVTCCSLFLVPGCSGPRQENEMEEEEKEGKVMME